MGTAPPVASRRPRTMGGRAQDPPRPGGDRGALRGPRRRARGPAELRPQPRAVPASTGRRTTTTRFRTGDGVITGIPTRSPSSPGTSRAARASEPTNLRRALVSDDRVRRHDPRTGSSRSREDRQDLWSTLGAPYTPPRCAAATSARPMGSWGPRSSTRAAASCTLWRRRPRVRWPHAGAPALRAVDEAREARAQPRLDPPTSRSSTSSSASRSHSTRGVSSSGWGATAGTAVTTTGGSSACRSPAPVRSTASRWRGSPARAAGRWMGGGAPVIDAHGNVYVADGNGNATSSSDAFDDSDAVLEALPDDAAARLLRPVAVGVGQRGDQDLGSGSPSCWPTGTSSRSARPRRPTCSTRRTSATSTRPCGRSRRASGWR